MAQKKAEAHDRKGRKGYRKLTAEKAQKLDLAVGEFVEGRLGPVRQSTLNPNKLYRTITTGDGSRYYIQGAAFEMAGILEMATGAVLLVVKTKDVSIKGRPKPMIGYDCFVPDADGPAAASDDGSPS